MCMKIQLRHVEVQRQYCVLRYKLDTFQIHKHLICENSTHNPQGPNSKATSFSLLPCPILQNRLPLIFIPPTANIHRLEQTAHGQHWHLSSPGCLKLSESLYCFMQLRLEFFSGTAGEFSSPGSTFCADSYFGIRFTPVLPQ